MEMRVFIYKEPRLESVDYNEVASFIEKKLPAVEVELREPLLEQMIERGEGRSVESLAVALAKARVRDLNQQLGTGRQPLPGEVDFELRRLVNVRSRVFGILYDGWILTGIYRDLIHHEELKMDCINVVFTNQLIATWHASDKRYHSRTVAMGSPAVLSVTGLIEAPAKAPGYYVARRSTEALGFSQDETLALAKSFTGDHLRHDDSRITDVAKGYALQPLAYRITGEPFCDDGGCRLYNAHWQADLIQAQMGSSYDLCPRHEKVFREFSGTGDFNWI